MNISDRAVEAALRRGDAVSKAVGTRPVLDYLPNTATDRSPKSLSKRAGFLNRSGAHPSTTELERLLGTNDLVDEFYLERALLAAHPICRISLCSPSGHERGCATGVMISPGILLTNEHVFGSAAEAAPSFAEFNYRFDIAGCPEPSYRFRLRPDLFFFNKEALDFALVAVEPLSVDGKTALKTFGYHRLIADSGKVLLKEWMTIIQHPGGARRQFAIRENQCVQDQDPDVIWYVSDTAQGSSGAPVFNDSLQMVALHHSGIARRDEDNQYILKSGKKVSTLSDVDDSEVDWVANAGIRVSRICACIAEEVPEQNGYLAELKAAMQGGDIMSNAYRSGNEQGRGTMGTGVKTDESQNGGGRLVLGTLVLELNSSLAALLGGTPAPVAPVTPTVLREGTSDSAEAMKEPIIDRYYASRTGFDTGFLGVETPFPEVVEEEDIAVMIDGGKRIPYQHFSVVMHKERKLAIYTAANVDGRAKARCPEPGDYTRDALSGLSKKDLEKWVLDPRLDAKYQIPDKFYNKDNQAFDKGHIVRRDDVCFGKSYAEVQRANGDTFHVTNCSPQRGKFNRSSLGGIWGHLENFIGAQADKEQYCLFAGPVLSPDDKTFSGTEDVKIPTRFWKVVCAVKKGKLQVFAFLLQQDVADLPLEFQVDAKWKHKQLPLKELEDVIGLVRFPELYHQADQGAA